MKYLSLTGSTFLTIIPYLSSATVLPRADPATIGGGTLWNNAACIGVPGVPTPLLKTLEREDLAVNTCYDAPFRFGSFKGYPIILGSEYAVEDCHFQVYWEEGCKGGFLSNQVADKGFAKCYEALTSPEISNVLGLGGISYKFACSKTCA